MKIGFDNEKYLKMQSEHIRNRIGKLVESFTLNLAESSLTTTTPPAFFRDLNPTVNSVF